MCGDKNPLVKDLFVRKWECPVCHTIHDRDINAAKNIRSEGILTALEQSIVEHSMEAYDNVAHFQIPTVSDQKTEKAWYDQEGKLLETMRAVY